MDYVKKKQFWIRKNEDLFDVEFGPFAYRQYRRYYNSRYDSENTYYSKYHWRKISSEENSASPSSPLSHQSDTTYNNKHTLRYFGEYRTECIGNRKINYSLSNSSRHQEVTSVVNDVDFSTVEPQFLDEATNDENSISSTNDDINITRISFETSVTFAADPTELLTGNNFEIERDIIDLTDLDVEDDNALVIDTESIDLQNIETSFNSKTENITNPETVTTTVEDITTNSIVKQSDITETTDQEHFVDGDNFDMSRLWTGDQLQNSYNNHKKKICMTVNNYQTCNLEKKIVTVPSFVEDEIMGVHIASKTAIINTDLDELNLNETNDNNNNNTTPQKITHNLPVRPIAKLTDRYPKIATSVCRSDDTPKREINPTSRIEINQILQKQIESAQNDPRKKKDNDRIMQILKKDKLLNEEVITSCEKVGKNKQNEIEIPKDSSHVEKRKYKESYSTKCSKHNESEKKESDRSNSHENSNYKSKNLPYKTKQSDTRTIGNINNPKTYESKKASEKQSVKNIEKSIEKKESDKITQSIINTSIKNVVVELDPNGIEKYLKRHSNSSTSHESNAKKSKIDQHDKSKTEINKRKKSEPKKREYSDDGHKKREYSDDGHKKREYSDDGHKKREYSDDGHKKREYSDDGHKKREYSDDNHKKREHSDDNHKKREHSDDNHKKREHSDDNHKKREHSDDNHKKREHSDDGHKKRRLSIDYNKSSDSSKTKHRDHTTKEINKIKEKKLSNDLSGLSKQLEDLKNKSHRKDYKKHTESSTSTSISGDKKNHLRMKIKKIDNTYGTSEAHVTISDENQNQTREISSTTELHVPWDSTIRSPKYNWIESFQKQNTPENSSTPKINNPISIEEKMALLEEGITDNLQTSTVDLHPDVSSTETVSVAPVVLTEEIITSSSEVFRNQMQSPNTSDGVTTSRIGEVNSVDPIISTVPEFQKDIPNIIELPKTVNTIPINKNTSVKSETIIEIIDLTYNDFVKKEEPSDSDIIEIEDDPPTLRIKASVFLNNEANRIINSIKTCMKFACSDVRIFNSRIDSLKDDRVGKTREELLKTECLATRANMIHDILSKKLHYFNDPNMMNALTDALNESEKSKFTLQQVEDVFHSVIGTIPSLRQEFLKGMYIPNNAATIPNTQSESTETWDNNNTPSTQLNSFESNDRDNIQIPKNCDVSNIVNYNLNNTNQNLRQYQNAQQFSTNPPSYIEATNLYRENVTSPTGNQNFESNRRNQYNIDNNMIQQQQQQQQQPMRSLNSNPPNSSLVAQSSRIYNGVQNEPTINTTSSTYNNNNTNRISALNRPNGTSEVRKFNTEINSIFGSVLNNTTTNSSVNDTSNNYNNGSMMQNNRSYNGISNDASNTVAPPSNNYNQGSAFLSNKFYNAVPNETSNTVVLSNNNYNKEAVMPSNKFYNGAPNDASNNVVPPSNNYNNGSVIPSNKFYNGVSNDVSNTVASSSNDYNQGAMIPSSKFYNGAPNIVPNTVATPSNKGPAVPSNIFNTGVLPNDATNNRMPPSNNYNKGSVIVSNIYNTGVLQNDASNNVAPPTNNNYNKGSLMSSNQFYNGVPNDTPNNVTPPSNNYNKGTVMPLNTFHNGVPNDASNTATSTLTNASNYNNIAMPQTNNTTNNLIIGSPRADLNSNNPSSNTLKPFGRFNQRCNCPECNDATKNYNVSNSNNTTPNNYSQDTATFLREHQLRTMRQQDENTRNYAANKNSIHFPNDVLQQVTVHSSSPTESPDRTLEVDTTKKNAKSNTKVKAQKITARTASIAKNTPSSPPLISVLNPSGMILKTYQPHHYRRDHLPTNDYRKRLSNNNIPEERGDLQMPNSRSTNVASVPTQQNYIYNQDTGPLSGVPDNISSGLEHRINSRINNDQVNTVINVDLEEKYEDCVDTDEITIGHTRVEDNYYF